MSNFEKWDKEFRVQNLYAFNHNENGLLWLKVRAVCRGKQIKRFVTENHLTLQSTKLFDQNVELFQRLKSLPHGMKMLDQNHLDNYTNETLKPSSCLKRITTKAFPTLFSSLRTSFVVLPKI